MSPENKELHCHHDTNKKADNNDTFRPSDKSDKSEEAHKTESRDNHAETRNWGREGKEKIRTIDISSTDLVMEFKDQANRRRRSD
jgi:hypothetical protein